MNDILLATAQRMIDQRNALKLAFRYESSYLYPVCACALLKTGNPVPTDELKAAKELLKKQTGAFSNFRNTMIMPSCCYLAMHQNDPAYLQTSMDFYQHLKKIFGSSEYTALLSLMLPDLQEADHLIDRGQTLYQLMKKEHPFLTSSEDKPAAVLLAASAKTDEQIIQDMEAAYRFLKDSLSFADSNGLQAVSQLLAGGDTIPALERLMAIRDHLEHAERKYGKGYELSALAALAMCDPDPQRTAEDILEADAFLKNQKGYGVLGHGAKIRLMHAAMLVSAARNESDSSPYMMSSALSMAIMQNAVLCCAVTSSAVSASSSSSH
ncbi:MAG: DUF4003 family protein [Clostridia bacterium]|nr:DUF4003 family protein [Clostridia bacterium]